MEDNGKAEAMVHKKILIPMEMLIRIGELLCYLDVSPYDCSIQDEYNCILNAILNKLQAIELRKAYSNIINAKDEDKRFYARLNYLQLRYEHRQGLFND